MESEPLFKDSPDPGAKPANPIGAIVQRSSHKLNLAGLRRGLPGWKTEAILGLGLLLVGMLLFFRVDQIPGDFEDARFNMYVLEHGYRWLVGLLRSSLDQWSHTRSRVYPVEGPVIREGPIC